MRLVNIRRRNKMPLCTLCVNLALMLFVLPALQSGQQPIDGANAVLADPLLDKMVGHWTMNGKLMGRPTTHTVDAKWVLNHQFLEIHEWGDLQTPRLETVIQSDVHNRL